MRVQRYPLRSLWWARGRKNPWNAARSTPQLKRDDRGLGEVEFKADESVDSRVVNVGKELSAIDATDDEHVACRFVCFDL